MSALELLASRPGQLVTNVLMAAVWGRFAWNHALAFTDHPALPTLVLALTESVLVVLFLFRKPATAVAPDWMGWALAIGGTAAPLCFQPTNRALVGPAPGVILSIVGAFIALAGVLSLNRSFGIVPARREIKTGGLYQLVRHPIYASYVFTFTGYLLSHWQWLNLAIYGIALGFMVLRIREEEKILSQDAEYRAYQERVPWRLIPFVY